jgi:hypothetical protein
MKIYIDESGGFSWGKEPDFSLFCGVTIADRDSDALFSRFAEWRRIIAGDSKREIKGSELSDPQLEMFADQVLSTRGRDILLTVVGLDTTKTKREHIEELRRQAWVMSERSAEIAAEHRNAWLTEFYRQQAGWMKKRSDENLFWMVGLVHTIFHSLQQTLSTTQIRNTMTTISRCTFLSTGASFIANSTLTSGGSGCATPSAGRRCLPR